MPDRIGSALFWLFSAGAIGFGAAVVVQRNPARSAIAFAFVILSTCGLFLSLAAPFLMAVTIVVYAGAIIVTFLFVLMLSQVEGPSDENDRSREPLLGALAGFAFVGLVLFTLYLSAPTATVKAGDNASDRTRPEQRLPVQVLAPDERAALLDAAARLDAADPQLLPETGSRDARLAYFDTLKDTIGTVVGSGSGERVGWIRARLEQPRSSSGSVVALREDEQATTVLRRVNLVRELNDRAYAAVEGHILEGKPDAEYTRRQLRALRDEVALLAGAGELPARNVGNLGTLLYSQYLLTVELAGTLLLVATIGAIAITQRKGTTA